MIVWGTRTPVYLLVKEVLYPTKLIRQIGYWNYSTINLILQDEWIFRQKLSCPKHMQK